MIGLGNAARGDDAAGLLAARALGGIELEGDPSALVELLSDAGEAVIIDAVRSGAPPGTVHTIDVTQAPLPAMRSSASTHLIGLAEAIELARTLGRLPARTTVYGIEGARFETGAPVSDPVAAAIARLVESVSYGQRRRA